MHNLCISHAVKAGLDSLGVEGRLSRLQFQTYIDRLTQDMNLEECAQFFEFLFTNLKVRRCEVKRRVQLDTDFSCSS